MNRKIHAGKYICSDLLSAGIAWYLLYLFRKVYIESANYGFEVPLEFGLNFWTALFGIPLFWLLIYFASGYYRFIYRKSRLKELGQTFMSTLVGVIIIFFVLLLDDTVFSYMHYYQSFLFLFGAHFTFTYIPRLIITTITIKKIHSGKIGFNTILIGSNGLALNLYNELSSAKKSHGNKFVGFVNILDKKDDNLCKHLLHIGSFENLVSQINKHDVEEVIIAIERAEHKEIEKIITTLQAVNVVIKIIPGLYDLLTGTVRMSSFLGTPLIIISHRLMPAWQASIKRFFDLAATVFAFSIFSPIFILTAIGVKLSSKGPIIFKQQRIGERGKPFMIYKFRSMYINAEKDGPQLSSSNDSRITKFGKFMRKTRLDEIPQFYNVLKGEMSLVGPRPERQFYIDKIVERAPHYLRLLKVKPGVTSWGQVKYGYAENVDEMIERLGYDILYVENMSLYYDFKILIQTILIVLKRDGK